MTAMTKHTVTPTKVLKAYGKLARQANTVLDLWDDFIENHMVTLRQLSTAMVKLDDLLSEVEDAKANE
jgi:hypothetical protein